MTNCKTTDHRHRILLSFLLQILSDPFLFLWESPLTTFQISNLETTILFGRELSHVQIANLFTSPEILVPANLFTTAFSTGLQTCSYLYKCFYFPNCKSNRPPSFYCCSAAESVFQSSLQFISDQVCLRLKSFFHQISQFQCKIC